MATNVPDNHDKAHEVMSTDDAIERGKKLAERNNELTQERQNAADSDTGHTPEEGHVPENNDDNNKDTGDTEPGDLQETRNTKKSTSRKK